MTIFLLNNIWRFRKVILIVINMYLLISLGCICFKCRECPAPMTPCWEFILLGLTDRPELQPLLFVLLLVTYLVTLFGNLGMMVLIRLDSRLHTPMYFFLTHLSLVDLCYTSTAAPQMLTNLLSQKTINPRKLLLLRPLPHRPKAMLLSHPYYTTLTPKLGKGTTRKL